MTLKQVPVAPLPVSPGRDEATGHYRIRITDLVLPASIGIHDHEKQSPQRVRINVNLKVAEYGRHIDDDIATVVSYEGIVNGIREIIARGHINLVETLAEEIAALCLEKSPVVFARVGVDKLDVVPDAAAVGVEIERSR